MHTKPPYQVKSTYIQILNAGQDPEKPQAASLNGASTTQIFLILSQIYTFRQTTSTEQFLIRLHQKQAWQQTNHPLPGH